MRTLALAALPTLLLALPAAGDVVFDSSRRHTTSGGTIWKMANDFPTSSAESDSTIESPGGVENEARAGAVLTLAGKARFITSVSIGVWGPLAFPAKTQELDVRLSLYTNGGGPDGQPGKLLWTGVEHVTITPLEVGLATFRPEVTVPDQVFYTLSYHKISVPTRPVGAWLSTVKPSVGVNGPLMSQDSTTLVWAPSPRTQPGDNLELRVEASGMAPPPRRP